MTFTFKIPLIQETSVAFQDSFGKTKDPIRDARAWIYQVLTKQGSNWTTAESNGIVGGVIIDKKGNNKKEEYPLKDINIKDWIPESDPEWIPEKWDSENIQPFVQMIGKSLLEDLEKLFAVNRYVAIKFNDSQIEYQRTRDDVEEKDKEVYNEDFKKLEEDADKFKKYPIEKFLHDSLLDKITEKVKEHKKKLFEKEFDELYPTEEQKKADEKKKEKKKKEDDLPKDFPGSRKHSEEKPESEKLETTEKDPKPQAQIS